MKYREWMIKSAFVLIFLTVFIITGFVWQFRPLLLTTQWEVETTTHSGNPISVKIYKKLGCKVFFLYINGGDDILLEPSYPRIERKQRPRWFTIDFSASKRRWYAKPNDKVHVFETYPSSSPYLHYQMGRRYGIDILEGKLDGEDWHLSYTDRSVVFSNQVFFVSMSKKDEP